MTLLFNIKPLTWQHQGLCGSVLRKGSPVIGPLGMHRLLGTGGSNGRANQTEGIAMEREGEDGVRSGLAGFLGDMIWQVGQIGQAALDVLMLAMVALLIYHHGAVWNADRSEVDYISAPASAPQPAACGLSFGLEGLCIVVLPLEPAAT
jgi:hypothetical protein